MPGLKPFEIQTKFKYSLLSEFLIHNPFKILNTSQKESCPVWVYLPGCQIWKLLELGSTVFLFYKCGSTWMYLDICFGPGPVKQYQAEPTLVWNWHVATGQLPQRVPSQSPIVGCHRTETARRPRAPLHATLSSAGIPVQGESRVCLLVALPSRPPACPAT
jgi:hypothetical protein